MLPEPPAIWGSGWINVLAFAISADDVAQLPYTNGLLVKYVAFLRTLHWPAGGCRSCVGGISYVELLILYELWACEREGVQFQCRLFHLVQALIFGDLVGILVRQ